MLVFRGGKQIHEEHTLYIPSHLLIRYLEETCTQSATKPDVLRDMFFFQHKSWILREMLLRLLRVGANFLSPRGQDAYGHGQQWVTNNWTKKPDVFLETACGNVGISIFWGGKTSGRFWFHQKPLDGVMESIDLLQDVDDVYLNIVFLELLVFQEGIPLLVTSWHFFLAPITGLIHG